MAPKKKPQRQSNKASSSSSSSKSNYYKPSSGPKLQISAENEDRLRRLLLNSGRTGSSVSVPINNSLSKAQKTKKLINIYEKLTCEGFVDDQIDALSSLRSGSVTIDGWLKVAAPPQTAVLFKELRLTLHSILKDLIRKPEKPEVSFTTKSSNLWFFFL